MRAREEERGGEGGESRSICFVRKMEIPVTIK